MPKTNTEKIDELSKLVATVAERVDYLVRQTEGLAELTTKVALLEQRVTDFRTGTEESSRRRWSVILAVASAIVGGLVTLGVQAILKHYWP